MINGAFVVTLHLISMESQLLSLNFQAEHGPDSQVVLVIVGDDVDIAAIEAEISKQCDSLPRGEFASKALSHSFTIIARDMVEVDYTYSFCYQCKRYLLP